jgi:hypothetical protein
MGANASNQTLVLVASIQKNTKHLFYNNQKLVFDYWRKLVFEGYETGPYISTKCETAYWYRRESR